MPHAEKVGVEVLLRQEKLSLVFTNFTFYKFLKESILEAEKDLKDLIGLAFLKEFLPSPDLEWSSNTALSSGPLSKPNPTGLRGKNPLQGYILPENPRFVLKKKEADDLLGSEVSAHEEFLRQDKNLRTQSDTDPTA